MHIRVWFVLHHPTEFVLSSAQLFQCWEGEMRKEVAKGDVRLIGLCKIFKMWTVK
jgi:hypothetical protein